ncbi:hypothetical protein KJI95_07510 [Shewanella sp. JM162201]|uniref:Tetratricopeptide repeat protein n=1 Tax=Shewanella jiangmenensis TaxID=2837387 RepID=A0ABS5V1M2_9GAMM|nr:hypothetical protein [Shewanella jiangmenensis]MBT1444372.1 hypothetical protein [Shewanella jiangmenensis]
MKTGRYSVLALLTALWLAPPASALMTDLPAPELAAIESRYQAGEYQAVFELIDADASPELMSLKLRSLLKLERDDDAETLLGEWLAKHQSTVPNAKAQQLRVGGDIYAVLAQRASLFSAPGLAGKSLEHYQQAHKLAPKDLTIARSLFGYYLYAPGIVGGDEAKAREVAIAIGQFAPLEGQQALLDIHLKNKDFKAFDAQFAEARKAFPTDRMLSLQQARRFEDSHAEAAAVLEAALSLGKGPGESPEFEAHLAYQLIKHAAKGKLDGARALELTEGLFGNVPKMYRGWAELRKAELLMQLGDKDSARQWLAKAEAVAPDDKDFVKQSQALKQQL